MDISPAREAGASDLRMVVSTSLATRRPLRKVSQVNTGDSMSCTNLSIWTSKATVTSRSALEGDQNGGETTLTSIKLTKCIRGLMHVRTPVQANKARTPPRDYGTKTCTES